ncbi:MAG: hypothetical protein JW936_04440 [Sedimentisphaerales bacterium]|nr:hypothetical protein [Sedimentisphaerales bacterium]
MKQTMSITAMILTFMLAAPLLAVDLGFWDSAEQPLMNEDPNTPSGIGQWTETFIGNWGVGSWVQGHGSNADGEMIWQLQGPTIVESHPSVFSDSDCDGNNDTILTNYQGGTFWLYDAPGLWGTAAEFSCIDTIIEDHINPFEGTYEYGYVRATAINTDLELAVNVYGRVIETSVEGSSHSGELTEMTIEIIPLEQPSTETP